MAFHEIRTTRPVKPYCMLKSSFTSEIYIDIVDIYGEVVGVPDAGYRFRSHDVEEITRDAIENTRGNVADEYRFGSRFSVHGKLYIWRDWVDGEDVFYFSFDPNDVETEEAYRVKDEFARKVNEYLVEKGLAVQAKAAS